MAQTLFKDSAENGRQSQHLLRRQPRVEEGKEPSHPSEFHLRSEGGTVHARVRAVAVVFHTPLAATVETVTLNFIPAQSQSCPEGKAGEG